jgi:hypothetical protein
MAKSNFAAQITQVLKKIQLRIDTTDYFVDKPKFDYQPIPWIGISSAGVRGKATVQRWEVIKHNIVPDDKSMKDIGCCVGYFCISASREFKIYSIGFDSNDKFLRIADNSMPKEVIGKCNFVNMLIDEDNVGILSKTDITLCLSIWHHWVYSYGLSGATNILRNLWSTTGRVMFFESGEEEVKNEFNLPYVDGVSAADWLEKYLVRNLRGAKVLRVGKFFAGKYPHYEIKNKKRTLFRITKAV